MDIDDVEEDHVGQLGYLSPPVLVVGVERCEEEQVKEKDVHVKRQTKRLYVQEERQEDGGGGGGQVKMMGFHYHGFHGLVNKKHVATTAQKEHSGMFIHKNCKVNYAGPTGS